jgi:hypothetical protein
MAMFAITFPIPPGKTDHWKKFIHELNTTRKTEFAESRKKLGVRERTFLQHTPHGDMVIVTLEGNDPAGAFARFAQSNDAFSKWFHAQVHEIHGVDLNAPPPGPMPEMIIDSQG